MNLLDVIIVVGVVLGLFWGAKRGFIGILILVVGIIISIFLVNAFAEPLSDFFTKVGIAKNYSYGVSVLFILTIVFLIFFIIHALLKRVIDIFKIGIINRILGALVGAWIIFVLIGSLYYFFSRLPLINFKKFVRDSVVAKYSYIHAKNVMSLSGTDEQINKFIEGEEIQ